MAKISPGPAAKELDFQGIADLNNHCDNEPAFCHAWKETRKQRRCDQGFLPRPPGKKAGL